MPRLTYCRQHTPHAATHHSSMAFDGFFLYVAGNVCASVIQELPPDAELEALAPEAHPEPRVFFEASAKPRTWRYLVHTAFHASALLTSRTRSAPTLRALPSTTPTLRAHHVIWLLLASFSSWSSITRVSNRRSGLFCRPAWILPAWRGPMRARKTCRRRAGSAPHHAAVSRRCSGCASISILIPGPQHNRFECRVCAEFRASVWHMGLGRQPLAHRGCKQHLLCRCRCVLGSSR